MGGEADGRGIGRGRAGEDGWCARAHTDGRDDNAGGTRTRMGCRRKIKSPPLLKPPPRAADKDKIPPLEPERR